MPSPSTVDDSVTIRPHEPEGECLSEWARCGGEGWKGHGSCCPGLECHEDNPWWSMCMSSAPEAAQPAPLSSTTAATTAPVESEKAEAPTGAAEGACLKAWSQCGGQGWKGQGTCCDGLRCHRDNDWWSACVPGASLAHATAVGRGAQRASSFLAPVQRHMLREAPALVQGASALSRKAPAADAPSKDDEL